MQTTGNPTRLSSCQSQLDMARLESDALGVRCPFAEQLGQCSRIGLHLPLEDRPSSIIVDANAGLSLRHIQSDILLQP